MFDKATSEKERRWGMQFNVIKLSIHSPVESNPACSTILFSPCISTIFTNLLTIIFLNRNTLSRWWTVYARNGYSTQSFNNYSHGFNRQQPEARLPKSETTQSNISNAVIIFHRFVPQAQGFFPLSQYQGELEYYKQSLIEVEITNSFQLTSTRCSSPKVNSVIGLPEPNLSISYSVAIFACCLSA